MTYTKGQVRLVDRPLNITKEDAINMVHNIFMEQKKHAENMDAIPKPWNYVVDCFFFPTFEGAWLELKSGLDEAISVSPDGTLNIDFDMDGLIDPYVGWIIGWHIAKQIGMETIHYTHE